MYENLKFSGLETQSVSLSTGTESSEHAETRRSFE